MATKHISKRELLRNPKYADIKETYLRARSSFDGSDEEFDNFFTREYWDRRKKRRTKRKEYKSQGMSRKEARQTARREARQEVPRVPLKEALSRGFNVFKKVSLAVPRASARFLISVNFRGNAQKLWFAWQKGGKLKDRIEDKWVKLGGNPDKFLKSIKNGKDRRPIICGFNCKQQLAQVVKEDPNYIATEVAKIEDNATNDFSYDGGLSVATQVAIGGTIVSSIMSVVGGISNSKRQKEALAEQERVNNAQIQMATDQQKFENEQTMRMIEQQTSPVSQIQADPNLSPAEKQQAINELNKAQEIADDPTGLKTSGFGTIAMYVVGGLFAMVLLTRLAGGGKRKNKAPMGA
jgi:hypothetical protein